MDNNTKTFSPELYDELKKDLLSDFETKNKELKINIDKTLESLKTKVDDNTKEQKSDFNKKIEKFKSQYLQLVTIVFSIGILGISNVVIIPKLTDLNWENIPQVIFLMIGYYLALILLIIILVIWLKVYKSSSKTNYDAIKELKLPIILYISILIIYFSIMLIMKSSLIQTNIGNFSQHNEKWLFVLGAIVITLLILFRHKIRYNLRKWRCKSYLKSKIEYKENRLEKDCTTPDGYSDNNVLEFSFKRETFILEDIKLELLNSNYQTIKLLKNYDNFIVGWDNVYEEYIEEYVPIEKYGYESDKTDFYQLNLNNVPKDKEIKFTLCCEENPKYLKVKTTNPKYFDLIEIELKETKRNIESFSDQESIPF